MSEEANRRWTASEDWSLCVFLSILVMSMASCTAYIGKPADKVYCELTGKLEPSK